MTHMTSRFARIIPVAVATAGLLMGAFALAAPAAQAATAHPTAAHGATINPDGAGRWGHINPDGAGRWGHINPDGAGRWGDINPDGAGRWGGTPAAAAPLA